MTRYFSTSNTYQVNGQTFGRNLTPAQKRARLRATRGTRFYKDHFQNLVEGTFDATVTCDNKCQKASISTDCVCSCGGTNHGAHLNTEGI